MGKLIWVSFLKNKRQFNTFLLINWFKYYYFLNEH